MLIKYEDYRFRADTLKIIETANEIISDYNSQGLKLTLRQLYYKFVSRAIIPNNQKSYDNLGVTISRARLAGLISWHAIEDRTRNLRSVSHWETPMDFMTVDESAYKIDMWQNQDNRVEVWIEKDALAGVVERVCKENDVPFFACRGYNSQSEQWAAGRRLMEYMEDGKQPVIIHLGDHDPSGIDMTRDNEARLTMFAENDVEVRRIALNYDQVQKYNPPPNPTKMEDSRARGYVAEYGRDSWELDALEPRVIIGLIKHEIHSLRDEDAWAEMEAKREKERGQIREMINLLEKFDKKRKK